MSLTPLPQSCTIIQVSVSHACAISLLYIQIIRITLCYVFVCMILTESTGLIIVAIAYCVFVAIYLASINPKEVLCNAVQYLALHVLSQRSYNCLLILSTLSSYCYEFKAIFPMIESSFLTIIILSQGPIPMSKPPHEAHVRNG